MIKKLICKMWGCKFREKNFTRHDVNTWPPISYYRWKILKHCPRCGCKNPSYDEEGDNNFKP